MSADLPVGKFELCRELYELSGWGWANYYYRKFNEPPVVQVQLGKSQNGVHIPAYETWHLIGQLPQKVHGARLVIAGMPISDYWGSAYVLRLNISIHASQDA